MTEAEKICGMLEDPESDNDEVWARLPGYDNYQVSNLGNVRTNRKRNRNAKGRDYRTVKAYRTDRRPGKDYYAFDACNDEGIKRFRLHRAVLLAFVGECPDGMEACHYDGNRANNRLENLRWDTPTSNSSDQVRHGTHVWLKENRGSVPWSKLTPEKVMDIKKLLKKGQLSQAGIALRYGVCQSTICRINTGQNWKALEWDRGQK